MTGIPDAVACRVCLGFTHPLDVHGTGCPNAPMSAGDRDTLTDEEREALREASSVHSGDMKFWGHHLHAAVESIVAARVRTAQAQAWAEGRAAGFMKRPAAANPYRSDPGDQFQNPKD